MEARRYIDVAKTTHALQALMLLLRVSKQKVRIVKHRRNKKCCDQGRFNAQNKNKLLSLAEENTIFS